MSKYQSKTLVKKRAKRFELTRLLELKVTKAKSKMKNVTYSDLKIQDYLLLNTINISEAKAMFKFRLRMAPFGENFKGDKKLYFVPSVKSTQMDRVKVLNAHRSKE